MGSDISISMKTAAVVLALALGVSCDTLGGHSHGHGHGLRQGRQEEPLGGYGQPSYGDLDTAASDAADPLAMLQTLSPESPERIIQSTLRFQRPHSLVTVKLMEVTTPTVRLSARSSTSVPLMEPVVFPSTASSVPTEPSSTRTTSSATGGSTLTAPPPRTSTASMTNMLPRETPLLLLQVTHKLTMLPLLLLTLDTLPLLNTPPKVLVAKLADRDLPDVITEEDSNKITSECDTDYVYQW